MYRIKEIYFTIQGEGYHTGRPAVFIRFAGCNLWTGLEKDRSTAICNWCDTDFVGTDGLNGGRYTKNQIKKIIKTLWPNKQSRTPYVVCTGGEPLLQIDEELISVIHESNFEIGIETNGTILPPKGIDWICVSPKSNSDFILKQGNELKIVYPQYGINPKNHENLNFNYFFIQPMDGPKQKDNIKKSEEFIMKNPQWRLSLQTHKIMGIP